MSKTAGEEFLAPPTPQERLREEVSRKEREEIREGQRVRIEALRAASRVVAGLYDSHETTADDPTVNEVVIELAEHLARWIETGKAHDPHST